MGDGQNPTDESFTLSRRLVLVQNYTKTGSSHVILVVIS
ncbi:hypothetical protein bwei_3400 [Bacillus mycoides]|nr:hypothetical protein bwei_3400 [Bacillus mycoides]